jgi:hypothetical protein
MKKDRVEVEKEPLKLVSPVPCDQCGQGYLLPVLVPHFKDEENPYGPKEFSFYELYWKCSNQHCFNTVRGD